MKYIKLFLLILLLVPAIHLSAIDFIEPDKEASVPEIEPLKIDLEALKKKSKIEKVVPSPDKSKRNIKTDKIKSGKSGVVKNKKVPQKKKSSRIAGSQVTKTIKNVKAIDKSAMTQKKIPQIQNKTEDKNFKKTEIPEETFKQKFPADGIYEPVKLADEGKNESVLIPADLIVINPSKNDYSLNRLYSIDYSDISKWAKNQGLKVKEDSPPVVDSIAFYTPDFFAEFKIENYNRNKEYKLFVDIVRFSGDTIPVNSLLKISGRSSSGKLFHLAAINREYLKENKIFECLIPYELSSPGKFDIIVREYSDVPGKWGIWDIIITNKKFDTLEIVKPEVSEKIKEIEPKIFK